MPTAATARTSPPLLQDGYQPRYFVLESLEEGAEQLKAYCRTLQQNIPDEVRAAVGLQL